MAEWGKGEGYELYGWRDAAEGVKSGEERERYGGKLIKGEDGRK